MIGLSGLLLTTGRHASARNILSTYARFVDQGMLPNILPDNGEQARYNAVDASLWYFEAWRAYISATHDMISLREIYPLLQDMIDWHVRGTRYGIQVDPNDGLLRAGEPGVQLTWMDAMVDGWVVTPRQGKPVEVNALWFNALMCMVQFSQLIGKKSELFKTLSAQARSGFQRFLKPEGGLYDVLDGPKGDDISIRPNQILAVTLHYSPLSPLPKPWCWPRQGFICLPLMVYARWRRNPRTTAPVMRVMCMNAIVLIIREQPGAGCCHTMQWQSTG